MDGKEREKLDKWVVKDNRLKRSFKFKDFKESIDFVNKVAGLSESVNHHPSIIIDYNKVEIVLWTHSEGEVTEKDYNLAGKIDEIQ